MSLPAGPFRLSPPYPLEPAWSSQPGSCRVGPYVCVGSSPGGRQGPWQPLCCELPDETALAWAPTVGVGSEAPLDELSGSPGALRLWTSLSFLPAPWPQSSGALTGTSWAPARYSRREAEAPWPFRTQLWKTQSVTSTTTLPETCLGFGDGEGNTGRASRREQVRIWSCIFKPRGREKVAVAGRNSPWRPLQPRGL